MHYGSGTVLRSSDALLTVTHKKLLTHSILHAATNLAGIRNVPSWVPQQGRRMSYYGQEHLPLLSLSPSVCQAIRTAENRVRFLYLYCLFLPVA